MSSRGKNTKFRKLLLWSIPALLVGAVALFALKKDIVHVPANKDMLDAMRERNANLQNRHDVDSAIGLLHSGDLVMRRGIDVTSFMLSQMNLKDKTYSHCGIVEIENGYPFVYHSIGGEDNPNAKLRRDSASFFFSPLNNLGFGIARYDLSSVQLDTLEQTARLFYKEHRRFDMKFDLNTDDRLYCSEFVYKALCRSTGDSCYVNPVSVMGFSYIGIDNLYQNQHTKLIWQVKFK